MGESHSSLSAGREEGVYVVCQCLVTPDVWLMLALSAKQLSEVGRYVFVTPWSPAKIGVKIDAK